MKLCVVVILALLDVVTSQCSSDSERSANAVELKFYRVQMGEWNDNSWSGDVAVRLISEANSYCASNSIQCGLSSCCTNSFKESMVVTQAGYPQNSLKDMLLKISLDLPENSTESTTPNCVVPMSVLQTIVGNAREAIHTDTGYWITYVDDEYYGIPPPTELNKIIIPIACAVILILAILTVVLSIWNKKREESLRRQKIIEQRKAKAQKTSPVYVVDKSDIKVPSGVAEENGRKDKPKRKNQLYKDSMKKSSTKGPASIASEDSAIKVDGDTRHRQAFSYEKELDGARGYDGSRDNHGYLLDGPPASHLQPIDVNDQDRSPEKKKKKKKKRSKSKEVMETTNEGFSTADD